MLYCALSSSDERADAIVRMFLNSGADVNARAHWKQSSSQGSNLHLKEAIFTDTIAQPRRLAVLAGSGSRWEMTRAPPRGGTPTAKSRRFDKHTIIERAKRRTAM